ncbi:hypothetical protein BOX15_Mlig014829g10 [Macrostomum lignano]|uniref:Uncharacterized protein n=1 Tax=Macrostomum lignano TaxID=282301 RepID=A0A267E3F5_9PLAT|nr:hypothetical protein BOX15_Mlig014829g10 [Macrostomum lignano]
MMDQIRAQGEAEDELCHQLSGVREKLSEAQAENRQIKAEVLRLEAISATSSSESDTTVARSQAVLFQSRPAAERQKRADQVKARRIASAAENEGPTSGNIYFQTASYSRSEMRAMSKIECITPPPHLFAINF